VAFDAPPSSPSGFSLGSFEGSRASGVGSAIGLPDWSLYSRVASNSFGRSNTAPVSSYTGVYVMETYHTADAATDPRLSAPSCLVLLGRGGRVWVAQAQAAAREFGGASSDDDVNIDA
jgi:uncharacterized protein (DUF2342 family)